MFSSTKDDVVLAIAEAAQNIVKHAYQGEDTDDKMEIKISLEKGQLEIGFFDKGRPVEKDKIRHRRIDDIKPGGLGTFFIQQIMDAVVFKEGEKPRFFSFFKYYCVHYLLYEKSSKSTRFDIIYSSVPNFIFFNWSSFIKKTNFKLTFF